jgi:hypothetical protein
MPAERFSIEVDGIAAPLKQYIPVMRRAVSMSEARTM